VQVHGKQLTNPATHNTVLIIHYTTAKIMIKDVAKWLKTAPRKSEIVEIQTGKVKDGKSETVKIIPQKIIESLLDELTEQNWSTRNFQFNRWESTMLADGIVGKTFCDASLELVVTYKAFIKNPLAENGPFMTEKEITRVLVGAYSFDVSLFGNDHIANTAKSLCISNAASDLGCRFGKDLNPKEASMMILGIKPPVAVPDKGKIGETLDKLKGDLTKKMIG